MAKTERMNHNFIAEIAAGVANESVATQSTDVNLTRGGRPPDPMNSLEIGLIARRHVRSMIRVLTQIAKDKLMASAARVQAAKEIIRLAAMEKSALDNIDDEKLNAMAAALVRRIQREQAELKQKSKTYKVVDGGSLVETSTGESLETDDDEDETD